MNGGMMSVAFSAIDSASKSRTAARWMASRAMCRCGDHSGNLRKMSTRCAAVYSGPTIRTKTPSLKYDGGSTAQTLRVRKAVGGRWGPRCEGCGGCTAGARIAFHGA